RKATMYEASGTSYHSAARLATAPIRKIAMYEASGASFRNAAEFTTDSQTQVELEKARDAYLERPHGSREILTSRPRCATRLAISTGRKHCSRKTRTR
ncbi:hypothetical protein, partial [Paraburkholderia sediminicola]|uniref:hypothetical protein n=1 Tax=Paraburkholderia sediminicola TaxID=458836 RepID=UPI0038BC4211